MLTNSKLDGLTQYAQVEGEKLDELIDQYSSGKLLTVDSLPKLRLVPQ